MSSGASTSSDAVLAVKPVSRHRAFDRLSNRFAGSLAGVNAPLPFAAALLLAALGLLSAVASAEPLDALAESFDAEFRQALAERDVPGGAYAIVHRGQVLRIGTYGVADSSKGREVDENTVFRIASLSKGFSGVLAALLATEQRFELEQPVAPFVPSFQLRPQPRPLTVEDVLGQRSGFVRNAYDNLIEAGLSRDKIIPRFNTLEPLCSPGECYSYQNNVFSLIEDVIAESTGRTYADLVAERLFGPLGMARASVGYEAFRSADNRAEPHLKIRAGWHRARPRSTYYQVPSAAGINASIIDMAHWTLAMLGHRPDVVPAAAVDEVLRPRIRTRNELNKRSWRGRIDDAWYGLGWRIYRMQDRELALHGGWVAGYRAEIALARELDLGLVLLTNAETRVVGELNSAFWSQAFTVAPGAAFAEPTAPTGASAAIQSPH
jgi:beta-lactamase class C